MCGVHDRETAATGWDHSQGILGITGEQPVNVPESIPTGGGYTGYIRSGTGMPSRPRPVSSTRKVSADRASLLRRTDSSACSTGQCS